MSYASAYSFIPGRVHVKGFTLRGADYNIQFALEVEDAVLDVNLIELASKRLEGSDVHVSGVSFKLRHKVRSTVGQEDRLAAFPPIDGYDGPPLYEGSPPETSSEELSKRWVISLSNVRAEVDELWIMEHRYRGSAVASGAFELHPGSRLRLTGTNLVFESGDIRVADRTVASSIDGQVTCDMPTTDLRDATGMQVLDEMSATAVIELQGGTLDFLDVYLSNTGVRAVRGPYSAEIDIRVDDGSIASGTSVLARSTDAKVTTPLGVVAGDASVRIAVPASGNASEMIVTASSSELTIVSSEAPSARDVELGLSLMPLDLTRPMSAELQSLQVDQLSVPDLGWVSRKLGTGVRMSGAATATLDWAGNAGELEASIVDGSLSRDELELEASSIELTTRLERPEEAETSATEMRLSFERLQVRHSDDLATVPKLDVISNSARFRDAESRFLQGTFDLELQEAQELLKLALPDVTAPLAKALAGVDDLQARVAVYVGSELTMVELLSANSGDVDARGTWKKSNGLAKGRFALETSLGDLGLRLDDSNTTVNVGIKADAFLDDQAN